MNNQNQNQNQQIQQAQPEKLRELLIINQTHYKNDGYTFEYNFNRMLDFPLGSKISLYSLAMYNSTFNIRSDYNNNTFSITWIDGNSVNVVIPDGYYTYTDISQVIQYYLVQNNWYWIYNNVAVYPITTTSNDPRYSGQINIVYVPSSTDTTGNALYSYPRTTSTQTAWTWPTQRKTPQITFSAGLGLLFGFKSQLTFPLAPQQINYSYISDITPIISPVYCYVITCNLLNTHLNPSINNVLSQIPLNNSFGGLITLTNSYPQMININPSKYNKVVIKFLDQNLNPIKLADPEITLILVFEY